MMQSKGRIFETDQIIAMMTCTKNKNDVPLRFYLKKKIFFNAKS